MDFDRRHGVVLVDAVDDEPLLPFSSGEIEWCSFRTLGLVRRRSVGMLQKNLKYNPRNPSSYRAHNSLSREADEEK